MISNINVRRNISVSRKVSEIMLIKKMVPITIRTNEQMKTKKVDVNKDRFSLYSKIEGCSDTFRLILKTILNLAYFED